MLGPVARGEDRCSPSGSTKPAARGITPTEHARTAMTKVLTVGSGRRHDPQQARPDDLCPEASSGAARVDHMLPASSTDRPALTVDRELARQCLHDAIDVAAAVPLPQDARNFST